MAGQFEVIKVTDMDSVKETDVLPESDFAMMNGKGQFVQMKFHEKETGRKPVVAKPGVYTIIKTMAGLMLEKTEFTQNNVLREFVNTKEILEKCTTFFSRLHVYEKYKIFPKRGLLLYGPPGTGKSTAIAEIANSVKDNEEYFVLVWHTDVIDAGDVKDFIKNLEFQGPTKMILVVEDIGGIEVDNARIRSESSLLALLDNQEKSFKIPVFIMATTNYIENFMGNLTNRPGRFDEKIKVGFPDAAARKQLIKHYDTDNLVDDTALEKIASKACDEFTPAQLQEIIVRSDLSGKNPNEVIDDMVGDIKKYNKNFADNAGNKFGING